MKMARGSSLIEENIFLGDYEHRLIISDKRRYLEKTFAIEVDPYCILFAELNKDNLPPVPCIDVFNYLVLDKSFCTSQKLKAFKSSGIAKVGHTGAHALPTWPCAPPRYILSDF